MARPATCSASEPAIHQCRATRAAPTGRCKIANAIYDAMSARQVRYINPPPSFEGTGQKIRLPHEVLVDRWGTCLDLATTYAAALEQAGLNPVLVLCDGHAFCRPSARRPAAARAGRARLPDDPQLRRERAVDPGRDHDAVLQAEGRVVRRGAAGHAQLVDGRHRGVECLIDVAAAHRFVRPIPAITVEEGVRVVEVERLRRQRRCDRRPPRRAAGEPAARGGERPRQDYPPRVARWRSSLLDLSFRNPLLNMRAGRTALDLHVPQGALGTLEDLLFDGRALNADPARPAR